MKSACFLIRCDASRLIDDRLQIFRVKPYIDRCRFIEWVPRCKGVFGMWREFTLGLGSIVKIRENPEWVPRGRRRLFGVVRLQTIAQVLPEVWSG